MHSQRVPELWYSRLVSDHTRIAKRLNGPIRGQSLGLMAMIMNSKMSETTVRM
jgi:hypothetical protein